MASLPLRKCGLKFFSRSPASHSTIVTSLAEVWIEILAVLAISVYAEVTSLAEVWIEMMVSGANSPVISVTSLAEVWIEIY